MAKIPEFKSEEEEIEFWDTHSLADYLGETEEVDLKIADKRPGKKRTTIYLTTVEHEKIRRIAFARHVSMAEFIRQAVREKVKRL